MVKPEKVTILPSREIIKLNEEALCGMLGISRRELRRTIMTFTDSRGVVTDPDKKTQYYEQVLAKFEGAQKEMTSLILETYSMHHKIK